MTQPDDQSDQPADGPDEDRHDGVGLRRLGELARRHAPTLAPGPPTARPRRARGPRTLERRGSPDPTLARARSRSGCWWCSCSSARCCGSRARTPRRTRSPTSASLLLDPGPCSSAPSRPAGATAPAARRRSRVELRPVDLEGGRRLLVASGTGPRPPPATPSYGADAEARVDALLGAAVRQLARGDGRRDGPAAGHQEGRGAGPPAAADRTQRTGHDRARSRVSPTTTRCSSPSTRTQTSAARSRPSFGCSTRSSRRSPTGRPASSTLAAATRRSPSPPTGTSPTAWARARVVGVDVKAQARQHNEAWPPSWLVGAR